ncbi:hypothetical protein KD918_19965, partial [Acinetobacter baumannii]|uniref:hypothetical protein n=1 Tax=Acinetobacter baumannii TaxID=470 RepID=UPI001B99E520
VKCKGGEETMVEGAQEVEVMATLDKEMLEEKARDEQVAKRERATLRPALDKERRTTIQIRRMKKAMLNATTIINLVIMQVSFGKSTTINQNKMQMWLIQCG